MSATGDKAGAADSPACLACGGPSEQQEMEARRKAIAARQQQQPEQQQSGGRAQGQQGKTPFAYMHSGCPVNRRELGRASWAFLHTMAAYYPEKPSKDQQKNMRDFMHLYIKNYPCGYCGDTSWQEMMRNPPRVDSRREFAQWMCEMHNEVNDRLGKPLFDCAKVDERWRTGPTDGSCHQ